MPVGCEITLSLLVAGLSASYHVPFTLTWVEFLSHVLSKIFVNVYTHETIGIVYVAQ